MGVGRLVGSSGPTVGRFMEPEARVLKPIVAV